MFFKKIVINCLFGSSFGDKENFCSCGTKCKIRFTYQWLVHKKMGDTFFFQKKNNPGGGGGGAPCIENRGIEDNFILRKSTILGQFVD